MRTWAALLALLLEGCADGIAPWSPPVTITHTFQAGEVVECTESLFRIGLPDTAFQVIGWAQRRWTCQLHRKPPTQVDGAFRK